MYRAEPSWGIEYLPRAVQALLVWEDAELHLSVFFEEMLDSIGELMLVNGFSILLKGLRTDGEFDIVLRALIGSRPQNAKRLLGMIIETLADEGYLICVPEVPDRPPDNPSDFVVIAVDEATFYSQHPMLVDLVLKKQSEKGFWYGKQPKWPQTTHPITGLMDEVSRQV